MGERRATELGIHNLIQGREDKLKALTELLVLLSIELKDVAYMGDDLPDIEAIANAGIGACPADAAAAVLKQADWISSLNGGEGCVREFVTIFWMLQTNEMEHHGRRYWRHRSTRYFCSLESEAPTSLEARKLVPLNSISLSSLATTMTAENLRSAEPTMLCNSKVSRSYYWVVSTWSARMRKACDGNSRPHEAYPKREMTRWFYPVALP